MTSSAVMKDGVLFLSGQLDEKTDLSKLAQAFGKIRINFRGVNYVNSMGLARLLGLVQSRSDVELEFYECSTPIISSINQIPRLLGPKRDAKVVKSFFLPFQCTGCRVEADALIQRSQVRIQGTDFFLDPIPCTKCGVLMRPTAELEDYLEFLIKK